MKQQSWDAWVRLGVSLHGPFIEDVTIYDCADKPGYQRAHIVLGRAEEATPTEEDVERVARAIGHGRACGYEMAGHPEFRKYCCCTTLSKARAAIIAYQSRQDAEK